MGTNRSHCMEKEEHKSIGSRIPVDFYRLFNSKYMEYYQKSLVHIYEESSQAYSLLGLTEEECQEIINEMVADNTLDWSEEQYEDEGKLITKSNMASIMLGNLENWGWLRRDYDEQLNTYVVSFPDYSQMYVDLFQRLYREDDGKERESLLSVYSYLFTYQSAREKDNDILKSALQTSKALLQMLSNMQEGIRGYFEELSKKRTFLGIQEVLIDEINNSDSKKYAILTTTDSFYRYKEEVKELIDANLQETQKRQQMYEEKRMDITKETLAWHRNERLIKSCMDALDLLYQINREFDGIERRYNRLIEQKKVFAKRAAARIRYILVEGDIEEDRAKVLVKLLNVSSKREEIIEKLGEGFHFSSSPRIMKEKSFARPRSLERRAFMPQLPDQESEENMQIDDFVVRPLYTQGEIREFRRRNETDGVFHVTEDTVHSVEDLEKLLFVWQEETEKYDPQTRIEIKDEFTTDKGFRYSGFSISKK